MTKRFTTTMACLAMFGCAPQEPIETSAPGPVRSRAQAACQPAEVDDQTFAVMQALEPHCAGCHNQGGRGYFASPQAFMSLLVLDPNQVVPGDPDGSELIRLLEGQGTGAFQQMPIGVRSYKDLAEAGDASMPMSEIRAWVAGLTAQTRDRRPNPEAARVRRKSASEIKRALYQQLGLDDADFFGEAADYGIPRKNASAGDRDYPFAAPEEYPAPRRVGTRERFFALGGGSVFGQVPADQGVAPTAALTLMQVSQAWCRKALQKAGNTVLFPQGGGMSEDVTQVKDTMRRWSLHFWGERMEEEEVEMVYGTLFEGLISGGPEAAYTGLCSFYLRHPRWLLY